MRYPKDCNRIFPRLLPKHSEKSFSQLYIAYFFLHYYNNYIKHSIYPYGVYCKYFFTKYLTSVQIKKAALYYGCFDGVAVSTDRKSNAADGRIGKEAVRSAHSYTPHTVSTRPLT